MMTREQKQEAEAVIYGLAKGQHMAPNPLDNISAADVERMRLIVNAHDQQSAPKEFDLNNPPVAPYRHQEFPSIVYHHEARKHKLVHNEDQLSAAYDEGFLKEPFSAEVPEVELDAASAAEAAQVDAQIAKKKRTKQAE